MAGRVLLAAVVSAVLLFMWGFVFWRLLNFGGKLMQPLPAELDVLAMLRNSGAPSGMYVYPMADGSHDEEDMSSFAAKHENGPLLQLAYRAEGGPVMTPSMFGKGLGHYFSVALLTGMLLAFASGGLPSFGSRVLAVLLVSLVSAFWANGGDLIWWMHSPRYCLGNMAYTLGAGLLMALVTAAIVKQRPAEVTGN